MQGQQSGRDPSRSVKPWIFAGPLLGRQPISTGRLDCDLASGTFRGGYYRNKREAGPSCTYATDTHAPTYHDYSTGFRCCAEAKR